MNFIQQSGRIKKTLRYSDNNNAHPWKVIDPSGSSIKQCCGIMKINAPSRKMIDQSESSI